MCETEFLIMASDDDVFAPTFLEEIDELQCAHPNVDLLRARTNIIDENGTIRSMDIVSEKFETQLLFLYDFICHNKIKCISNCVFRTKALKSIGGFVSFPLAWVSDEATIIKLAENGVCNTQNVHFSFRCSGINISTIGGRGNIIKKTHARIEFLDFLEEYFKTIARDGSMLQDDLFYNIKHSSFSGYNIRAIHDGAIYANYKEMKLFYKYLKRYNHFSGKLDKLHFFIEWAKAWKVRRTP